MTFKEFSSAQGTPAKSKSDEAAGNKSKDPPAGAEADGQSAGTRAKAAREPRS